MRVKKFLIFTFNVLAINKKLNNTIKLLIVLHNK